MRELSTRILQRVVLFLLNTGLRREEAIQLKKTDVDFTRNIIHVSHSKTNHIHSVPLNRIAREVIDRLDNRLFNYLGKSYVAHKFGEYLDNAELSEFKLHSLRHTFATNLNSQGVDIYTVSRLLGHSDIKTTLEQAVMELELNGP
jgi:integrase